MIRFSSLRIPLCLVLCSSFAVVLFSISAVEERFSSGALSLAALQQLVSEQGRVIRSFRLEGVVCSVVPKRRLIVLQDESATALLELPTIDGKVCAGDRLAIEGENCSLVQGTFSIQIGRTPVVDNDGHHPAILKTGKVFLQEGLPPVRLGWFNRTSISMLDLEWEGPGLRRQKVPSSVLWRKTPDGLQRGLDFTAHNGGGEFLADFETQEPVAQGIATNFDISCRARREHTALFFSGCIEIPREGIYTFYLTSDDGAQLWVGDPSVSCTRLAADPASVPEIRALNQARAQPGSASWVELEGEVTFAGANREHLELDLLAEGDRVPVTVVGGAMLLSSNFLHGNIRVKGICQFSREEKKLVGVLVPSIEQVEFLGFGRQDLRGAPTNQLVTSVSEARQLEPERVAQGLPVRIKGVVIGQRLGALMVQDSTGGISVRYSSADWAHQPLIGDLVEVEGVTGNGSFAPVIMARKVRRLGKGPMPDPILPHWDRLMNGSLDCEYVEIRGILMAASSQKLTLYTGDGTIEVEIFNQLPRLPLFASDGTPLLGSLVRLRGCSTPAVDVQTRQVLRGNIHLDSLLVTLEELAPRDPFSLPTRKIAELLWFDARASALQRIKLKGQVLNALPGEYWVLEAERGFRVLTSKPVNVKAGDLIEAVGFAKLDGPSLVLQGAQVQQTGRAPLPVPVPVPVEKLLDRNHDSTLVQVEAILVGETTRSKERILELQAGPHHFLAVKKFRADQWPRLAVGSRLQLVGVYASASENHAEGSTDPFSLFLVDGAKAVKVLKRPSWWTAQQALIVAGVLAGALGVAFVWITLLRRKVEIRTTQLRKEIEERQCVEQDHAIEQERMRVAQDLHDELGAGLTTVGILGALVQNPATPEEKKPGYLEQITLSAHSLVTALDEIVWAVNPQHDSIASLADYYAYFAQPFLNAAGIACRLEIAERFPEHPMDPQVRHGVFLAFKEALNNVVRHAGATEVKIKIVAAGEQLIIAVTDNGRGITLLDNPPDPAQHGLSGMRDRLTRLGGSCCITSQPGQGTTVEFRISLRPPRSEHEADAHCEDVMENKL